MPDEPRRESVDECIRKMEAQISVEDFRALDGTKYTITFRVDPEVLKELTSRSGFPSERRVCFACRGCGRTIYGIVVGDAVVNCRSCGENHAVTAR